MFDLSANLRTLTAMYRTRSDYEDERDTLNCVYQNIGEENVRDKRYTAGKSFTIDYNFSRNAFKNIRNNAVSD